MITKEQLASIDYHPSNSDPTMYVRWGSWEYGYDIIKQELWYLNDGYGDPEYVGTTKNFETLKEILDMYGEL